MVFHVHVAIVQPLVKVIGNIYARAVIEQCIACLDIRSGTKKQ